MKALSIQQPWAWAVLHAGKNIENRKWNTDLREQIAIHAPATMHALLDFPKGKRTPQDRDLVMSAVVGVARLVDVVTKSKSVWYGGPFGFVLQDMYPLSRPVPCSGMQKFWELPKRIEWEVCSQLPDARHFIAYNMTGEWTEIPNGMSQFRHYSGHAKSKLEKCIGQVIWMVERIKVRGQMTYWLCGRYRAERIEPERKLGGWRVCAAGRAFSPKIEITHCKWFAILRKEQNNFSFGLNQIRDHRIVNALEDLASHPARSPFPDELQSGQTYCEGNKTRVIVNAYERDAKARAECLAIHGRRCSACDMDFVAQYGEYADGLIHVHHCVPLAHIGHAYQLNPSTDLVPVCPNCHAVIHWREPMLSVEEVRDLRQTQAIGRSRNRPPMPGSRPDAKTQAVRKRARHV